MRLLPVLLLGLLLWPSAPAAAQGGDTIRVTAGDLAQALAQAAPGDTIEIDGGVYYGSLVIDKRVALVGRNWPVIDGQGSGTVLALNAPGISVSGLVIRNSGDSLDQENSGIAAEAANITIAGNRLEDTLFGIYLRQASGGVIRDNEITSKDLEVQRRGDPIRIWASHDVLIENNSVVKGRDVVLWYSERLTVRHNEVQDGRYGLHFMYCDDAVIENNRLLGNSVGAFLMYSRRMQLRDNTIAGNRGPSGFGIGLKDMDDAVLVDNLFLDNRVGAHVDNSPREVDSVGHFAGNVFAYNDIGVELMPSVRNNEFSTNSFVDNREQVAIAGRGQANTNAWTVGGQGNYWSDYAGYDADGDGQGDIEYRSQRWFEDLMARQPILRLFIFSPATGAIDFAARAFPAVRPQPKLVDDQPLMAPIVPQAAPALPEPAGGLWPWLGLGLVLIALGLTALPRLAFRSQGRAPLEVDLRELPMIEVLQLTKRYGPVVAVDDLSLTVAPGQAVAFWGANGAGKTTAIRCLLNLIPFQGQVTIAGLDVQKEGKAVRRLVGFVPQELTLHDDMGVQETLLFYARLKKVEDSANVEALLSRLGLAPYLAHRVGALSGGLKQRLALAIALLSDPPLLVLDEPTANLDIRARDDFLQLLLDLKQAGKTLVFSSHRLEEVTALADRVLLLESGRLVVDAPPHDLAHRLGRPTTLHVYLAPQAIEPALSSLEQSGFQVHSNGRGVRVQVEPGQKSQALQVLHEAGLVVEDFTVE